MQHFEEIVFLSEANSFAENITLPTRYKFTGQYSYVSDSATDLGAAGFGLMFYNARWRTSIIRHPARQCGPPEAAAVERSRMAPASKFSESIQCFLLNPPGLKKRIYLSQDVGFIIGRKMKGINLGASPEPFLPPQAAEY